MQRLSPKKLITFGSCLLLCQACMRDPSRNCEVAPCPNTPWKPCFEFSQPEYPRIYCYTDEDKELDAGKLIDIALVNNPLTRETWYNARAAAFEQRVQESVLYPFVDFNDTVTLSKTSPGGPGNIIDANGDVIDTGSGYTQTITHQLAINYLVLDFGGRNSAIEAARQALFVANWSHNRQLQTVVISVLTSYYNYLSAKALREAIEEDLTNSQANLEAAQSRFEAGVATKLDLLLAESNYVNTQANLEVAKGRVNITEGELAKNVGWPANTPMHTAQLPEKLPLDNITKDMDILLATAKTQRPDLAAAYSAYLAAQANVNKEISDALPNITANVNLQRTNFFHNPIMNNYAYSGSLSLNVPLFHGFLHKNRIAKAKALVGNTFAAWQEREDTVLLDVVTSYYTFITASKALTYAEEYLKYTQEAYNAALASYREGVVSFLDLLTSQVALSNAKAQLINAKTQLVTAIANLAYATGTI